MALKGQLQHFGLGEVFQALSMSRHTGSLVVQNGRDRKTIYFSDGLVTLVSSGGAMRFGEILIREHKVSNEQIREAVDEQRSSGKLMGRILVEKGLISQDDVDRALKKKIEEELYDLFLWETGTFEFLSGQAPPELLDPRVRHTQVRIDPRSVLLEGMRQLDEWKIIQARLPDIRAILRKVVTTPPAGTELDAVESHLWMQIPSEAPVSSILEQSLDTRFATLKILYRFIEEGWLKVLDGDEALDLARRLTKNGDSLGAKEIYDYLLDKVASKSADPEFLVECGNFLVSNDERVRGGETLLHAVQLFQERGDIEQAWRTGYELFERGTPTLELLRSLWQVRDGAPDRQMHKVRDALLERLCKQQKHLDVDELISSCPDEFAETRHLFARANALRSLKRDGEAMEVLATAARSATEEDDIDAQVGIANVMLQIDPSRADVKRRLKSLVEMKEVKEQRAKRRLTLVAVALGVTFLVAVVPIRYELKARETYQNAHMFHVAYSETKDHTRIISAYQDVIDQYPLSTRASQAQEAINKLLEERKKQAQAIEAEDMGVLNKVREERERKIEELRELRKNRKQAIESKDVKRAREICDTILADYAMLLLDEEVLLPLLIESTPPEAAVTVDGEPLGTTPVVYEFEPGSTFKIELRRRGYEPHEVQHEDTGSAVLSVPMKRGVAARAQLGSEFGGRAHLIGDSMVFAGRDGGVYALPLDFMKSQWIQWRQSVGIQGHRSADILPIGRGRILLAALSGELKMVADTGTQLWTAKGLAPWTTRPAIDDDGEFVALGDEAGQTLLIRSLSGKKVGSHRGAFPIDLVAISGSQILSADRALYLRRFEFPSMKLLGTELLPARANAWLNGMGLLLADGTLIMETERKNVPVPATTMRESFGRFTYGTPDGKWVLIDGEEVQSADAGSTLSCPPMLLGDSILLPGTDGQLRCRSVKDGTEYWSMAIESRVLDMITADGKFVFVFAEGAKILMVEEDGI